MPQPARQVETQLAVLGLDIAKDTVALYDTESRRSLVVDNSRPALRQALAHFGEHDLAVCEVTGGYERAVLDTAHALGLPIHRADPAKAKAFITSHGGHAKTDMADARWLARFGQERGMDLPHWSPPDADREALTILVRHRQSLLKQRTQTKNRCSAPTSGPVRDMLRAMLAFMDGQIDTLDSRIEALQASPKLVPITKVLRAIPGIGPVGASALIALLPELGHITRRQIASLAGLAPHPRESGNHRARRHTRGGRHELKPVLFMMALSAARSCPRLKPFYNQLLAAGKPKRLALTAVARKLIVIANARLRDEYIKTSQLT